jgi:hypothetical protein
MKNWVKERRNSLRNYNWNHDVFKLTQTVMIMKWCREKIQMSKHNNLSIKVFFFTETIHT